MRTRLGRNKIKSVELYIELIGNLRNQTGEMKINTIPIPLHIFVMPLREKNVILYSVTLHVFCQILNVPVNFEAIHVKKNKDSTMFVSIHARFQ